MKLHKPSIQDNFYEMVCKVIEKADVKVNILGSHSTRSALR